MSDVIAITEVKVNLSTREIVVTAEEARELFKELGKLFGIEQPAPATTPPPFYVPIYIPQPTFPSPAPQPWEPNYPSYPGYPNTPIITCENGYTGVPEATICLNASGQN